MATKAIAVPYGAIFGQGSRSVPPIWVEWAFYLHMFYSIMGRVFGLSFGMVGAASLGGLAVLCVLRSSTQLLAIVQPMFLLMACGVSFVGVQIIVHGDSLMSDYLRDFIPWMAALVVLQCLALRRGFLHRFAIATMLVCATTLPYLAPFPYEPSRYGLDRRITINNPNDLGAWFGFCFVYLTILGFETKRNWIRASAWVAAAGCLGVIGLTVSRGPLFAAAISIAIAFRRLMKRGFYPFLMIVVFGWIVYGFGWFEGSAEMYLQRGFEESGRFEVWPLAIDRFLGSPLTGVGVTHLETFVPAAQRGITPHNGFIFIALASGVVPFVFFFTYWLQLFASMVRMKSDEHSDVSQLAPLLMYAFLIAFQLNEAFMAPWVMAIQACVSGTWITVNARRAAVRKVLAAPTTPTGRLRPVASRSRIRGLPSIWSLR